MNALTNERARHLMQEALDENLSSDEEQELNALLQENPEHAEEFDAQQRVDNLLRYPPHKRAPERLALTIMARLAESVQAQHKAQEHKSQVTEAELQVAIQLVTVGALPLLVGAGYMLLNARNNPKTMERVLVQVAALLILVTDTMEVMIDEAASVYDEDPELALATLTMMPSTLLLLVKEILGKDLDEDEEASQTSSETPSEDDVSDQA